jgi:hypothetical protein
MNALPCKWVVVPLCYVEAFPATRTPPEEPRCGRDRNDEHSKNDHYTPYHAYIARPQQSECDESADGDVREDN